MCWKAPIKRGKARPLRLDMTGCLKLDADLATWHPTDQGAWTTQFIMEERKNSGRLQWFSGSNELTSALEQHWLQKVNGCHCSPLIGPNFAIYAKAGPWGPLLTREVPRLFDLVHKAPSIPSEQVSGRYVRHLKQRENPPRLGTERSRFLILSPLPASCFFGHIGIREKHL